jgi:putative transposase
VDRRLHLHLDGRGRLCVAAVIDLFSRRVVRWSMSAGMTAQLVADALLMTLAARQAGCSLASLGPGQPVHQRKVADSGIVRSMSRSGNVWDNAAMESFFSSLNRAHRR